MRRALVTVVTFVMSVVMLPATTSAAPEHDPVRSTDTRELDRDAERRLVTSMSGDAERALARRVRPGVGDERT